MDSLSELFKYVAIFVHFLMLNNSDGFVLTLIRE